MKQQKVRILSKKIYNNRYVDMWLENRFSEVPEPGQFVHIFTGSTFLRRPFSIGTCTEKDFRILFQIKGAGTRKLADMETGCELDIIGPLGNHFPVRDNLNEIYVVAGGIGIAPLLFLSSSLLEKKKRFKFFYGARTKSDLLDFLMPDGDYEKIFSTDDGSYGEKGTIVEMLKNRLHSKKPDVVFSSGPYLMLKEISSVCSRYDIPAYVSLENIMFCGLGVCQGCVIDAKNGYQRVCRDGPVFNHKDVIWQKKPLI